MKITIELSDQELEDVLVTAGASSAYCAKSAVPLFRVRLTAIRIHDRETNEPLGTLTRGKARKLTLDSVTPGARVLMAAVGRGSFDGNEADVWLQLALFGETRYG